MTEERFACVHIFTIQFGANYMVNERLVVEPGIDNILQLNTVQSSETIFHRHFLRVPNLID